MVAGQAGRRARRGGGGCRAASALSISSIRPQPGTAEGHFQSNRRDTELWSRHGTGGNAVQFWTLTPRRSEQGGSGRGGGGSKIVLVRGAVCNFPVRSRHFEHTHVRGLEAHSPSVNIKDDIPADAQIESATAPGDAWRAVPPWQNGSSPLAWIGGSGEGGEPLNHKQPGNQTHCIGQPQRGKNPLPCEGQIANPETRLKIVFVYGQAHGACITPTQMPQAHPQAPKTHPEGAFIGGGGSEGVWGTHPPRIGEPTQTPLFVNIGGGGSLSMAPQHHQSPGDATMPAKAWSAFFFRGVVLGRLVAFSFPDSYFGCFCLVH